MDYNIVYTSQAEIDFKNTIEYYLLVSDTIANKFITDLDNAIEVLKSNPQFQIRYRDYRVLKVGKFPYLIHFLIDEQLNQVIIYGLICTHRDPKTSWLFES